MRKLRREEMFAAAQSLGDRPQTAVCVHALLTGRCEAWIAGAAESPHALLIRTDFVPTEPYAFGRDTESVAEMLFAIDNWTCVNVGEALIQTLPAVLERKSGKSVRPIDDLYNVLLQPGPTFSDSSVRLLDERDVDLFAAAASPVHNGDRRFASLLLSEGLCAASVIDGVIVSRAFAYAITPEYAEIAAATLPAHRNRGLVTACASRLIDALRERTLTPVWSTGEANVASQRVASKLGFVATQKRVYLRVA